MFQLLVDAYFERFVIAVSARFPKEFKKEVYKTSKPHEVILESVAKEKNTYVDNFAVPFDKSAEICQRINTEVD